MSRTGRAVAGLVVVVIAGVLAWVLFVALPKRYSGTTQTTTTAPMPTASPQAGRRIKARLFYVAEDGTRLTGVDREVPYAEGIAGQAREIVEAQIAPASEPNVSATPAGTKLRALFVTERGDAYVDLTRELKAGQGGGPTEEMLAVYSIVNALTMNMPAIASVQILVDGKEAETLDGHVDLRRPLAKNPDWVQ